MQIKSKITTIIACFLSLTVLSLDLHADEFNITALEVLVDKENNIIIGKGAVEVTDKEGKLIKAETVTYEKSKEFLVTEGSVEVFDTIKVFFFFNEVLITITYMQFVGSVLV